MTKLNVVQQPQDRFGLQTNSKLVSKRPILATGIEIDVRISQWFVGHKAPLVSACPQMSDWSRELSCASESNRPAGLIVASESTGEQQS